MKEGTAIPVGMDPSAIAITHDGAILLVANSGDGTVTSIETATNMPGVPIFVGGSPSNIVITPDDTTAHVTDSENKTIVAIDIASHTVGTPIPF